MFFHKDNFREFLMDDDQACLMAKLANQILDENSKVFYGRMYSNGSCEDFGTEKKATDTHVCLATDISIMGNFKPSEVPISLERPTEVDFQRAQAKLIKQLELELDRERAK